MRGEERHNDPRLRFSCMGGSGLRYDTIPYTQNSVPFKSSRDNTAVDISSRFDYI